jgi:ketoreductase
MRERFGGALAAMARTLRPRPARVNDARRMTRADRESAGRVALVTGGGKGLGRAIALGLAARGMRVVVMGRDEKALGMVVGEIVYGGGAARHSPGDVRERADVDRAVDKAVLAFGRIDVVVANAGVSGCVPLAAPASSADGDADTGAGAKRVADIVTTNLLGTYHAFAAGAARMDADMKGAGRLIAISSVLGKVGAPGFAAYCASKAGIHGLVHAAAVELAPRGITCNAVCPGLVETDAALSQIDEIARKTDASAENVRRAARASVPLGRFFEPEEVTGVVAFLCSPEAGGITGQALSICGGATAFGG